MTNFYSYYSSCSSYMEKHYPTATSAPKANAGKVALKLIIDKKENRVRHAECGEDFINILLSFLTLPVGTIIRLVGQKSSRIGCFSNLYESVENLDTRLLSTPACKNMLLNPRSAAEVPCEDLKIQVDDLNPRMAYTCPVPGCFNRNMIYSSVLGVRCVCGETMTKVEEWSRVPCEEVFLKGGSKQYAWEPKKYMVTDDFEITKRSSFYRPWSLERVMLEERNVEVGREEVLSLLERSLLSDTPLTDVFLKPVHKDTDEEEVEEIELVQKKVESDSNNGMNKIELKLFVNKDDDQVLGAEANADFINLLFSFLTFPLGSVLKLLKERFLSGCVDKVYTSVVYSQDLIKSKELRRMLLNPKLATNFGCSKQILKIDESPPYPRPGNLVMTAVNPKLPDSGTKAGGSFVNREVSFMVTRDLVVSPMSDVARINLIDSLNVPSTSLEEKIVHLGEAEALNILQACLISDNALNMVFPQRKEEEQMMTLGTEELTSQ